MAPILRSCRGNDRYTFRPASKSASQCLKYCLLRTLSRDALSSWRLAINRTFAGRGFSALYVCVFGHLATLQDHPAQAPSPLSEHEHFAPASRGHDFCASDDDDLRSCDGDDGAMSQDFESQDAEKSDCLALRAENAALRKQLSLAAENLEQWRSDHGWALQQLAKGKEAERAQFVADLK